MSESSSEDSELFSIEEIVLWRTEWQDMPEYSHEDFMPKFQVVVNFACQADLAEFCKLVEQNIPPSTARQTKSIWFPEAEITRYVTKRYKAI